jgi:hypothetical protein
MPSYRRINMESPLKGIIKSSKAIDSRSKRRRHLKLDFVDFRRSITIDNELDSLKSI